MSTVQSTQPELITEGHLLRAEVLRAERIGQTVGLVPTMGALHEGHLSLVDAARRECDVVVATIFVNPTQFEPHEDFERYPRSIEADLAKLTARRCDLVFVPSVEEMYPAGCETTIDVGSVARPLEGEFRPNHFRGVATVVLKLLMHAPADYAYFGHKDYQQTVVVKQLVRDLSVPTKIVVCPIVREADGLAMSSRNAYLTADQRRQATVLYESLQLSERRFAAGEREVADIRREMQMLAADRGVELQYAAFVKEGTVTPVSTIVGRTVVAVAAKIGETRLIDNTVIG